MTAATTSAALSYEDFRNNFPFKTIHPRQCEVLENICDAFNSGFKVIVLEAPTGFGKSPVAIAVAHTLGSSYFCSATKELQTEYVNDFPFLRAVKGMGNYSCLVKEDFIANKTYACGKCGILDGSTRNKITNTDVCCHKTVEYGPCGGDHAAFKHSKKTCQRCIGIRAGKLSNNVRFHEGCRYRTYLEDYLLNQPNTDNEEVEMSDYRWKEYDRWYKLIGNKNSDMWPHARNFKDFEKIRNKFAPCPYYDQLNKGILASHSIFNYANFIIFQRLNSEFLPQKDPLVLDEGHSIENQIVERIGFSISEKILRRYIDTDILENISYGYYDNIEKTWLIFLVNLYHELENSLPNIVPEETKLDAIDYMDSIGQVIYEIQVNPLNWIVSKIENLNGKLLEVEFKPLDVSSYYKKLFDKCNKTLIMSATILDIDTFCRNLGLDSKQVKFISVDSDFPIGNRPIYQINTAYLNYDSLQLEPVQREISRAVNTIMDMQNKEKGIIHCTSYAQVHFIQKYISEENKRRLILTDPERFDGRDTAILEHFTTSRPTVLISPSLHTGLDLKDERSRFQIIVKVPYPSRKDRWIEAKRKKDGRWYNWQTSIRLVQAYGRSVRSRDDWAITYILDSTFERFIRRNRLPKWYTDAIM